MEKSLSMWLVAIAFVAIVVGFIWAMLKKDKKFRPLYGLAALVWLTVAYFFFNLFFFNKDL